MDLICNPCYKYSKCVKERFFRNIYLAYMFMYFLAFNGHKYINEKSEGNAKQKKSNDEKRAIYK